jgi:hypothetical protein
MINNFRKVIDASDAMASLDPSASFVSTGPSYNDIVWEPRNKNTKPSFSAVVAEQKRLQQEIDDSLYVIQRKFEYPPIEQYLDGIVKNDQDQIDAYKAAWNAVNAKYPAPGEQ